MCPGKMDKSKIAGIVLLLAMMIVFIYWPVQHHEFLNFDDQVYVTDNMRVREGMTWDNVKWAFGNLAAGFWHPVTWLSLMLDSSLYQMHAGGFHWTNVFFHIGSSLLIFFTWIRFSLLCRCFCPLLLHRGCRFPIGAMTFLFFNMP